MLTNRLFSGIFPCGRENAVSLGCAAMRGSGGLCAPIGLHAWRPGPMAEMGTGPRRVTRIAALLRAGVAATFEAQMVAEMRPHLPRPRGVRRLLPFGRAHHLGRGQMVQRDIALGAASATVAAGGAGAGGRAHNPGGVGGVSLAWIVSMR